MFIYFGVVVGDCVWCDVDFDVEVVLCVVVVLWVFGILLMVSRIGWR